MRKTTWTNADGLVIGFGTQDTVTLEAGEIHTKGRVRQVEMEIYHDQDVTDESVFNCVIPAGALIRSANMVVSEAFAGGTSVSVGVIGTDGNNADADALIAATNTASLTANADITGAGAQVGNVLANDVNITYATAGSFTAGRATLLVEYVIASAK